MYIYMYMYIYINTLKRGGIFCCQRGEKMASLSHFKLLTTIAIVIVVQIGISRGNAAGKIHDVRDHCGENAEFTDCPTRCPLTCENHDNPPEFCGKECDLPGCQCKEGFVQGQKALFGSDHYTGCVRPDECQQGEPKGFFLSKPGKSSHPPGRDPGKDPGHNRGADPVNHEQCGANAFYSSCARACPQTCDGLHATPGRICDPRCFKGCECKNGFVQNRDGQCVRPEECPDRDEQCGANAFYSNCARACPQTCDGLHATPGKICDPRCFKGCDCKNGFVQNRDGQCVRPEECPDTDRTCYGENEVFTTCTKSCPKTCHGGPQEDCVEKCGPPNCECKEGYVLLVSAHLSNGHRSRCVRPEECPRDEPDICVTEGEVILGDNYRKGPDLSDVLDELYGEGELTGSPEDSDVLDDFYGKGELRGSADYSDALGYFYRKGELRGSPEPIEFRDGFYRQGDLRGSPEPGDFPGGFYGKGRTNPGQSLQLPGQDQGLNQGANPINNDFLQKISSWDWLINTNWLKNMTHQILSLRR